MKTAILSPLQLRQVILLSLSLQANHDFTPTEDESEQVDNLHLDFEILHHPEINTAHAIQMKIALNPEEEQPNTWKYQIALEAMAFFELAEKEQTRLDRLIPNMVAMTYSEIRGIVHTITAVSAFGPYTLPTLDFVKQIKQKMQSESQKAELE